METSIETTLIDVTSTPILSSEILRAILADPPRKSPVIQAELLFLDGIYIFHHRDKEIADAHIYSCKFYSTDVPPVNVIEKLWR